MGKQSKRKNKRRGGGSGGGGDGSRRDRPTGLADDPAAGVGVEEEASSPVDNVVGKIRHGDPRVRHASLVALSGTLYDGVSLTNAARKMREAGGASTASEKGRVRDRGNNASSADASDPALLRALSERLLDPDIPCATAAAGCLSNFVSFYCGYGGDGAVVEHQSSGSDDVEVASDVMVPILLRRVETSLGTLKSLGSKLTSASGDSAGAGNDKNAKMGEDELEKLWPSFEEQWSLLSLSLITLAGLVENCPNAVGRTGPDAFPLLLEVPLLARDSIKLIAGREGGVRKDKEGEPILDAATNASRALHSLLDDNTALISSLPVGGGGAKAVASATTPAYSLISAVSQLTNIINSTDLVDMTRLHAAGAILSLRKVIILDGEDNSSKHSEEERRISTALQSCTDEVVVPTLFVLFQTDLHDPRRLLSQMITLSRKLSAIKRDQEIESQIVGEVNARKEPARMIAKRQKKLKEEKEKDRLEKEKMQQGQGGDVAMEEDALKEYSKKEDGNVAMVVEDDSNSQEDTENKSHHEDDLKQQLEDVVQSWRDAMGSCKLALELVANLCSGREEEEEDDRQIEEGGTYNDDDDEHMWDSDDEAKLIAAAAGAAFPSEGGAKGCSPCERATYNAIASRHLPEGILAFFKRWAEFLPASETEEPPPELVSRDVDELLATCALCLGNLAGCDALPTWNAAAVTAPTGKVVENGIQLFWWEIVSILSGNTVQGSELHITSVMLSLLRSQPAARTLVDSSTLDHLLALISTERSSNNNTTCEALVQIQCNVIAILGILCSEPHPASVDTQVCRALLEWLRVANAADAGNINEDVEGNGARNLVRITHEILNVLMDTYGADECHENVFEREDVLGHFRRCLPGFRRRVKKAANRRRREDHGGEADIWSETALNASRFIKYKEGK